MYVAVYLLSIVIETVGVGRSLPGSSWNDVYGKRSGCVDVG